MTAHEDNQAFEKLTHSIGDMKPTPDVDPEHQGNEALVGAFAMYEELPKTNRDDLIGRRFVVATETSRLLFRAVTQVDSYLVVKQEDEHRPSEHPELYMLIGSVYSFNDDVLPPGEYISDLFKNPIQGGAVTIGGFALAFNRYTFMRDSWPVWCRAYTLHELGQKEMRRSLRNTSMSGRMVSVAMLGDDYTTPLFVADTAVLGEKTTQVYLDNDGEYVPLLSYT